MVQTMNGMVAPLLPPLFQSESDGQKLPVSYIIITLGWREPVGKEHARVNILIEKKMLLKLHPHSHVGRIQLHNELLLGVGSD